MGITPIDIKINQTNQQNGGKTNTPSPMAGSGNSFDQIIAMFKHLDQSPNSDKQSAQLSIPNGSNQVGKLTQAEVFLNPSKITDKEPAELIELGESVNQLNLLKVKLEDIPLNSKEINASVLSAIPINLEDSQYDSDKAVLIDSKPAMVNEKGENKKNVSVSKYIESKKLNDEDFGKIDGVLTSLVSLMEQVQQLDETLVVPKKNAPDTSDTLVDSQRTLVMQASSLDTPNVYQRAAKFLVSPLVDTSDSPMEYQRPVEQPASTIQNASDSPMEYQRPVEQPPSSIKNDPDSPMVYQRPVEQPLTSIKNDSDWPMVSQQSLEENMVNPLSKSIQMVRETISQAIQKVKEEWNLSPHETNQILQKIHILLGEIKAKQSYEFPTNFEEKIQIILNGLKFENQSGMGVHSDTIERRLIPNSKQGMTLDKNQVIFSAMPQQVNPEGSRESRVTSIPKLDDVQKNSDQSIIVNHQQPILPVDTSKPENLPNKLVISDFSKEVSEWISSFVRISNGRSGSTEAKFSLFPEHLGHIEINVTTQHGQISAQILTDTSVAKEVLEGQLHHLKQALQQFGLQVQKLDVVQQPTVSVDTNQAGLSFSQDGSQSSRQQHTFTSAQDGSNEQRELSEQTEREREVLPITYGGAVRNTSSRIDFTA
ncbi:flagellar hook-length control protein FliK [Neobacillus sp. PS2-9]|uniref:flagellar hook-length control protein FliK n=1 Tax=Neobacillus sp. PS2-9 TaxID=3070676 RepID=UPI0027DF683B|nr:flagellar hook-length control protein FliK [Neobacillus sp. PS2-9]WML56336.1 flagellar hook-length control protein FliK [Neobacillus sp. PS2-9]